MSERIRILHLITSLNTGGAEMALLRLLEGMNRDRFEMQVVCMIPVGSVGEQIRALGIPVISLEMPPGRPTLHGFRQLVELLKKTNPDILQTWLYHADLLGLFAAKLANIPVVVWNVRNAEIEFLQARPLSYLVVKICARLSGWPNAVVINSLSGKTIHANLGYRPKEWDYIPNGIDTSRFFPDNSARERVREEWHVAPSELLIGIVGRLDPQKNHPAFLEAASLVQKQRADVHFVCIGTGSTSYQKKMVELADQLKLSNLLWTGLRQDMSAVDNALDVLVSSSISEGFPNVIAEAMACGKPCVVTDVGDSASLVGETGFNVPASQPQALAKAIIQMINLSETERARLGEKARQRIIEKFSLEKMVQDYTEFYERLA